MASRATKTKKSTATTRREPMAPVAPKSSWENPLIPHKKYQQLYASMLRAQMIEAKLAPKAQRVPEAVAAGLVLDLRAEDTLLSTSPAHRFLKNAPLKQLFKKTKTDEGFAAQNILPAIADASAALNAAAGIAFAHKLAAKNPRDSNIVLAFTADADACVQAARLAEEHRLPILFVYQQNAASAKLSMATRRYGIPGMPVDRDDAVAVYRVAQEGIARARSGGGPTLVECMRYTIPGKRPQSALTTLERNLTGKGLFTPQWKRALIAGFTRELAQARKAAKR
jgi:TPP-dependent pyruvate/acetoin dehydrogenase alpha subunit